MLSYDFPINCADTSKPFLFRTVWEIKQRTLVDMAADRGAFIDQSQSLNIHMDQANFGKLTSLHFHAWSKGLKTGMYYLRTRAAADAIKFTVDTSKLNVCYLLVSLIVLSFGHCFSCDSSFSFLVTSIFP